MNLPEHIEREIHRIAREQWIATETTQPLPALDPTTLIFAASDLPFPLMRSRFRRLDAAAFLAWGQTLTGDAFGPLAPRAFQEGWRLSAAASFGVPTWAWDGVQSADLLMATLCGLGVVLRMQPLAPFVRVAQTVASIETTPTGTDRGWTALTLTVLPTIPPDEVH